MVITPITFNTIDKAFLPTGSPFITLSSKENIDHARYVRRYYGLRKGHGQYAISSEPLTYVQVQHLLAYEFIHSTPVLDLYNADVNLSVCYANYLASIPAFESDIEEEEAVAIAEVFAEEVIEEVTEEVIAEVIAEETKPEEVLVEAPPVKKAPAKRRPAKKKVVDQA